MDRYQVNITFTEVEFKYFTKRASVKGKTLWTLMQSEINKSFGALIVPEDKVCTGNKERHHRVFDIPPRIWKSVVCVANSLGLTPSQLIYRVIVAPHLSEIIKENAAAEESTNA